jgi:hypothetical protein
MDFLINWIVSLLFFDYVEQGPSDSIWPKPLLGNND